MIDDVVQILVAARRSRTLIDMLPNHAKVADVAEAHAVQDATVTTLGDRVAGWKVAISPSGEVMRGVILGSRMFASPATVSSADFPLLGIEAEVAFRFDRDLPPQANEYSAEDVAEAVTALVGIEIVDSRFRSYNDTPMLDRTADFMSNGGFVTGTVRSDWRTHDLAQLKAVLRINGEVTVQRRAGHAAGHPLGPAVPLVNALRSSTGVRAGQVITTGTYTGLTFAKPGDHVVAEFTDFGTAEIRFEVA